MFEIIAFDADDTLWHTEPLYRGTQGKIKAILSQYHDAEWIERRMYETEIRNLAHYGYGIKGFTLSMIETAIDLTEGRISGTEIRQIIGFAREMLAAPLELLDSVQETLASLSLSHELMVITKGDLFEQEAKIARSGLGEYFSRVEIVSEKTRDAYESIALKHQINPRDFLMVGNSVKYDILPVIEMGGRAVHIPYQNTWVHETVPDSELEQMCFMRLPNLGHLPALIDELFAELNEVR
ncbi:MAG: HAD family hydrolase [Acidobacteria bacterium]|nr:HAD family hydrolase [Acidobacteriota bacterium]